MSKRRNVWMVWFVILLLSIPVHAMAYTIGRVVDFFTGKPVEGAFVTSNNNLVLTDSKGNFVANSGLNKLAVRAPGYGRSEQAIIPLERQAPRGEAYPFNTEGSLPLFLWNRG